MMSLSFPGGGGQGAAGRTSAARAQGPVKAAITAIPKTQRQKASGVLKHGHSDTHIDSRPFLTFIAFAPTCDIHASKGSSSSKLISQNRTNGKATIKLLS